ncbi:MAG TPA: hypothetical protein VKD72_03140 [Gemmataceae bacterium]|nr:hypothetical protein [Gemmataceae bacterium]
MKRRGLTLLNAKGQPLVLATGEHERNDNPRGPGLHAALPAAQGPGRAGTLRPSPAAAPS